MPVLLDVRNAPTGVHYDDVHWRMVILSHVRRQFGPRWAMGCTGPVTLGVGRMFAAFSEVEGLEVGLFADQDEAIRWLTAP